MKPRRVRTLVACSGLVTVALVVGACAVHHEYPYPTTWPPLVNGGTEACRELAGTYADRGDAPNVPTINRSLTFTLGWTQDAKSPSQREAWRGADRVTLALPSAESLEVVSWKTSGERIGTRVLTRAAEEYMCESGRATVRWRVYEAEDVVAAREDYTVELHRVGEHLVAYVRNQGIGTVFLAFPFWGTTSGWVRFARVP